MYSFKAYVFESSLYYILLMIGLPLVYAVTYNLPGASVFTMEWLSISLFLYPSVWLLSGLRYGYHRVRRVE